jgi:DNA polymerase IV
MTRKILHLDLDAFFCSVEELKDPTLIGKAFAVGGAPGGRGVVSSCSYPARMKGVRSAMPTGQALQLCPELILVSGRHSEYETYSNQVMDILRQYSGLVEVVSIDEAFVDISDLPDNPEIVARQIQQRVRQDVHLPCSIGIAATKLVAKIATDAGKARVRTGKAPCAITYVTPGTEEQFLAPLPVSAIWGVGPKMADRLHDLGIEYIRDLLTIPEADLRGWVGNSTIFLLNAAHGIDSSPVHIDHGIKSISQETTFGHDIGEPAEVERTLRWLTEKVARRLREQQLCGDTVRIKIRLKDFSNYTRQVRLNAPTDVESVILQEAVGLFREFYESGQYIRLIGVGVSGLGESWHQMSLLEPQTEKEIRLHQAVDELQQKFGKKALQRGKLPMNQLSYQLPGAYWVKPELFLAGPFPSSFQEDGTTELLQSLIALGVRQFIDLTQTHERQFDHYQPALQRMSTRTGKQYRYQRFPIPDHGIPTSELMRQILACIDESLNLKQGVYVHCWGGIGRTGTVVGCWLVNQGMTGAQALVKIKEMRKSFAGPLDISPETTEQRAFVQHWRG